jgi:hypothetical protein
MDAPINKQINFSKIYSIKSSDILKYKDKYKEYLKDQTEKAKLEELETAKNARNCWVL